ncbi:hypothetical protein L917_12579 [Phytophthora nicotianae]|uniref:Uncharacterized protein n=1 Tax=Phytophthora nicotianae TaxID=4792 RepID=W2KUS3_PHYNI|nr:hypothetical protein L917_12579 [Phytophthora nicotianae]
MRKKTHDLDPLAAKTADQRARYRIGFGPPDDSLQTYLRKIEVRAPGLIDQDARQLSL